MPIFAEQTIVPLFRAKKGEEVTLDAFVGTGFLIVPGLLVTCWHCIRQELPPDSGYLAVILQRPSYRAWLYNISRDFNGSDLATANVQAKPEFQFTLASERGLQGLDVCTFGYPFSGLKRIQGDVLAPNLEVRFFKGYIMRTFAFEYPEFGQRLSYEASFPAPGGLSGAPLIQVGARSVLGVVYGNNDVAITEHLAEVDSDGTTRPEIQRIVSFGLAHHTSTLRSLSGTATNQRPLAELVPSG